VTSPRTPTASTTTSASLTGVVFQDFNNDGEVDFGEEGISGTTIRLTGTDDLGRAIDMTQVTDSDGWYGFLKLRPGTYAITETQPAGYNQGINHLGTLGGTVSGDTFAVAVPEELARDIAANANGLNYNFGERPPAEAVIQHGQTAGIGFWNNKNGQALLRSLNGGGADGTSAHQLGDWLAATFPNMFGPGAGLNNNLSGKTNAGIAAVFQDRSVVKGVKLDAQVMATAFAVYVTKQDLAGDVAAGYGFLVGTEGTAITTIDVGTNGAAFDVTNGTVLTVMDLLLATNRKARDGVLYDADATLKASAYAVYSNLNQQGAIG
jgi:hypothetical protein